MSKILTTMLIGAILSGGGLGASAAGSQVHQNPFLKPYETKYQIPPFDQIEYGDYVPALKAGIAEHNAEIAKIVGDKATPTFENTVLALDRSGKTIDRVAAVLFALSESNNTAEMSAVSDEFMPLYNTHQDEVLMNDGLFRRVKAVYDNRTTLAPDQQRLVESYYKKFKRNGALLEGTQKEELKKINAELTDLYLQFNKNLLKATNEIAIVVDKAEDLSGLPQSSISVAAEEAATRGLGPDKWVFTVHNPSRLPVLQYADNRDLREKIYKAYTTLASSGQYNNYPIINKVLKARAKKAALLGFKNFGAYQTDNVMAKTVENAEELLMKIWGPAVKREKEEVAEMQAIVDETGGNFKIQPWDYYYYNEKVRQKKYNLQESALREYFSVDSVKNGIFTLANRLYGVNFTPMPDAPKYYKEVDVYDVTDARTGEHIAVFMTDYFQRPIKRQGAWMSEFKGSWIEPDGKASRPIIYNVGNFSRPTADMPSLLTIDEVETLFHEFGHGLHGMLSRARYKGISGTNVDRDFVELPSQIHEHWAFQPELLKVYAKSYKTGEVIPQELVEKVKAASKHNQGFRTTELAGAALLDLQYSKLNPTEDIDIAAFEKEVGDRLGMPSELTYRYRSPYFKHVFGSDEYSAGYYTYLWAEVLDTDGFELFEKEGIFNPSTAARFKKYVLEAGGSADPMELYIEFRGQAPSVDALLRNRGLEPETKADLKNKAGK